jgi:Tol biopolymer transport system component
VPSWSHDGRWIYFGSNRENGAVESAIQMAYKMQSVVPHVLNLDQEE